MSNRQLIFIGTALALAGAATLSPSAARAQSSDDQAVQPVAKTSVYRELPENLSRVAATRQQKTQNSAVIAAADALLSHASPAVHQWVREEGQRQAHGELSEAAIAAAARNRFGNDLSTLDIDALMQLVMAEVAHDQDQELRDQLAQMQATNHQKQAQRDASQKMRQNRAAIQAGARKANFEATESSGNRAELATYVAGVSDGKDSLEDMSEMDQMRLQMLMERRQKALETLGNLMKKNSDTANSIIGNLK